MHFETNNSECSKASCKALIGGNRRILTRFLCYFDQVQAPFQISICKFIIWIFQYKEHITYQPFEVTTLMTIKSKELSVGIMFILAKKMLKCVKVDGTCTQQSLLLFRFCYMERLFPVP